MNDAPKEEKTREVLVRLPTELLERVDAYVERINGKKPTDRVSRASILRRAIDTGMREIERKRTT